MKESLTKHIARVAERGAGRNNDPGAYGLQGAHEGAHWLHEGQAREGAYRNDIEKLICEAVKTYFLEITQF